MAEGNSRWLDRIVFGGLIFLVIFTPLAFGAVHRWAFVTMETVIFGLVAAWMVKLCVEAGGPLRGNVDRVAVRRLAVPAALIVAMVAAQLVPMPPSVMRIVSPASYRLYSAAFPGWPQKSPYAGLVAASYANFGARNTFPVLLPSVEEARKFASLPRRTPAASTQADELRPVGISALLWRTLSLAPSVTWSGLVEIAACGSLFFLVLLYPPGLVGESGAEARFCRRLVLTVFASGVVVALIGLAERAWWNGRLLWFFVPQDWGAPLLSDSPRASGPFVNPDHFANYLAMILPIAVVGALFPLPIVPSRRRSEFRFVCGVGALLMTAAIMLSLSRGGWLAAALAVCVGLALSFSYAEERAPALLRRLGMGGVPLSIAGFVAMVVLVLYLIGPAARTYVSARVGATVLQGNDLSARPGVWKDTLGMMRDFPLFGVGLGAWPDLFPHYERPPWFPFFFREAENDYVQFTAEMGLVGLGLLLWIVVELGRWLGRVSDLSQRQWPLYAALIAGVSAMLVHEFFDFNLHTPANAVLFVIMLALALRVTRPPEVQDGVVAMRTVATHPGRTYLFSGLTAIVALAFIAASFTQDGSIYPYDFATPATLARVESDVMTHPAAELAHLELAQLMPQSGSASLRRNELQLAVWLNPNDPVARDLYARALLLAGQKKTALAQIVLSVTNSPELGTHYYLEQRAIPWLLPDEQAAIDGGFRRALAAGYGGSFSEFATFYVLLGRYRDAAEVYAEAARRQSDPQLEASYLTDAGSNYGRARDYHDAERSLRSAITLDPYDPRPYGEMAKWVFLPKNASAATAMVDDGIRSGADPFELNVALAHAAEDRDDQSTAAAALERALQYRSSYSQIMELGALYMAQRRYDRAALTYRQAVELQPDSAPTFQALGQAEEAAYDYTGAAKDYQRAAELAPGNREYRQNYLEFQRRTAKSAANG